MSDDGSGSSRKPYLTLLAGIGVLFLLSLPFRLDAPFGGLWLVVPVIACCAGAAIQAYLLPNPRLGAGRRWLLYWAAPCVCAWLVFWRLHALWVLDSCETAAGGRVFWDQAIVVGEHWDPKSDDCPCARLAESLGCPEADVSVCRCIECMSFVREEIETCWGEGRIGRATALLAASYLLFAVSFGGVVGLRLLPLPPVRVFVSYRRQDSAGLVLGPIAGALRAELGGRHVFVDSGIKGGAKWRLDLRLHVETCDALVVVIGPDWLEALKTRAAQEPRDWVRYEIATAIQRGVTLVPVVFGGASMPATQDLGAELGAVADFQAVDLKSAAIGKNGDAEVVDQEAFEAGMDEVVLAINKTRTHQLSRDWRSRRRVDDV